MSAVTAAPAVPARPFREVWFITLGHALTHWYPATFYLLLPIIGKELGLSYSQIGLIMTCQYIAGAVANIPGGALVDTVGRKGRNFPRRKGLVLSMHGMGGNFGDALAPIVVGSLLSALTWRQVVMLNVVPGLVIALVLLVFLGTLRLGGRKAPQDEGAAHEAGAQSLGDYLRGLAPLFRNRSLLLLSTSSAFRSMTQNALLTFLPVYLAYEMGFSPLWVGACLFALQAAGFAAAPIAGHLSDRMGRRSIMMTSMAMTAVVLLFMAFAGKSFAFVVFVAVLGFFLYAIRPVLQAWLLETTPKNMGGTSIGVLFGAQSLGSSAAPLLAGMIADRYGLGATFYFLAATIVLANLFIFFMPHAGKDAAAT
jgi:sugar phosphate permease